MQIEEIALASFSTSKENTYNCIFFKMRKYGYITDDVILYL